MIFHYSHSNPNKDCIHFKDFIHWEPGLARPTDSVICCFLNELLASVLNYLDFCLEYLLSTSLWISAWHLCDLLSPIPYLWFGHPSISCGEAALCGWLILEWNCSSYNYTDQIKSLKYSWRDGQVVENVSLLFRGPELDFQHATGWFTTVGNSSSRAPEHLYICTHTHE